jgi:Papain fold toxin 1, glutamine deamidase
MPVLKHNPYHDQRGRFTTHGNAGHAGPHTKPTTLSYQRNNTGMRHVGGFDQDVEPWGRYMSEDAPRQLPSGWERGTVTFNHPLEVPHREGRWKRELSQAYGGATGQELSERLRRAGYDGIITRDKYGIGEIVDIRPKAERRHTVTETVAPGAAGGSGLGGTPAVDVSSPAPAAAENTLGLRRDPQPQFNTADLTAINPNWNTKEVRWQENCTRCSTATELRHRGYDVTAGPKPRTAKDNSYADVLSKWLSPNGAIAGTGPGLNKGVRPPEPGETLGMSSGNRVFHVLPAGQGRTNKRRIDDAVKKWGEGSRGFVGVTWKGRRSAHVFNVENRGGEVVYTDAQTNKPDASGHFDRVSPRAYSVYLARVDDLTPRPEVKEWVQERTDEQVAATTAQAEHARALAAGPKPQEMIAAATEKGHGPDSGHMGDFMAGTHNSITHNAIPYDEYSDNPERQEAYMAGFFWAQRWKLNAAGKYGDVLLGPPGKVRA